MLETTHAFSDLEELVGSSLIVRLEAEPAVVIRGETCRLNWTVSGADEVRLWHTYATPSAPEPLDWYRVFEEGEFVSPDSESKLPLERDTAFFVVARSGSQIRGERLLVEIDLESPRPESEVGCDPPERTLEKMEFAPHTGYASEIGHVSRIRPDLFGLSGAELAELWSAPPAPPTISITAPNPVIFTDESTSVGWNVSDTNCVSTGETMNVTRLLVDPTNPSGSKYDGGGWGSGWSVGCGGGNPGSRTIQGAQGSRHTVIHVHASNAFGKSGAKSQWVDTLGVPKFEGNSTAARQAWIRASFKKIDAKLREGRVLYDGYLDGTVKAFKKGCLTRTAVWSRLLAELENLTITPIKCEDTSDQAKAYASFESYTGRIILRWKPGKSPSEYALCHELVHKAGFHQSLYACGLSQKDIECGADHIASAILGLQPDPC